MEFRPIRKGPSLVDNVVEQVQGLIAGGHLGPGDRLPKEPELVTRLAVSRTVLREALGRLEATGLLTIERGRGMFVAEPSGVASCARLLRNAISLSAKDLAQFLEFRRMIECHAARQAALFARPDDIAQLEKLALEMNREGQDFMEAVRLDFEFHLRIVQLSRNDLLVHSLRVIQEFIMTAMVKSTPNPRDTDWSRRFHLDLVEALRTGNADLAEQAARAHMDHSERSLRERDSSSELH